MAEAEVILAHSTFKNSKRCVALFRHLVDRALSGEQEGEKERTLGIEVFGRQPDYDTNAEPVVRMTANEIRKRLAQFYQESNHSAAVKIRLLPGTYLLQFDFPEQHMPAGVEPKRYAPEPIQAAEIVDSPTVRRRRVITPKLMGVAVLVFGILATAASLGYLRMARSELSQIWAPLLASPEPVIVCVGELNKAEANSDWARTDARMIADRTMPQTPLVRTEFPAVPFVDVAVSSRITSWLTAHHKQSSIRGSSGLTLKELRQGPVVLIGAFDNPWALVLLSNLRYHVRVDPDTQEEWIEDTQKLSEREWRGSGLLGFQDTSTDYAIITRVLDQDTGKWILAVGGLGMHGTEAGAELLLDSEYAKLLPPEVLSSKKNFQVVVGTTVIGGNTGTPRILAFYIW